MAEGTSPRASGASRDGVHVLRGLMLCGLIVTAGSGQSTLHALLRTALPLLAGLGFGTALAEARDTDRGLALRWALHLTAMWLVTLSPAMWGHREVARTCAVAGMLAISFWSARRRPRAWMAAGVLVAAAAAVSLRSSWSPLGLRDVGYALGVAWPRGWLEVGRDTGLFLFGSWAAGGRGIRRVGGWRGIAHALGDLGRMPLTTALGQSFFAWALIATGRPDKTLPWLHPALVDGVLLTQVVFSWWWLRDRKAGPCEYVLGRAREGLASLRSTASNALWSPRSS